MVHLQSVHVGRTAHQCMGGVQDKLCVKETAGGGAELQGKTGFFSFKYVLRL